MKTVKHHSFTLWIHSVEDQDIKVPAIEFDEGDSFDSILLMLEHFDDLGLWSSLTCDTWSEIDESEEKI